jgi:hypothetical protein
LWEQIETTVTGEQVRKQYPVPKYLHPEDPKSWTVVTTFDQAGRPVLGDVIVAHAGTNQGKDWVFEGAPTPDMTPLDAEAEEISSHLTVKPGYGDEIPDGGYAGAVLESLSSELAKAMTATRESPKMDELLGAMAKMMEQNASLIAALGAKAVSAPAGRRP